MDNEKVKQLAKKFGMILVMNGNEPDFVILDYQKYLSLEESNIAQTLPNSSQTNDVKSTETTSSIDKKEDMPSEPDDPALIETLNKEIQALNEEIKESEVSSEAIEVEKKSQGTVEV